MAKKKPSRLGKTIVLLLIGAILFFLILPFLDGSATLQSSRNSSAKATPQIFTSNPLRNLAEKIMAAFSRKKPRQQAVLAAVSPAQETAEEERFATLPDEASQPPAGTVVPDEEEAEQTSPYAAFVDENGEWILVNQTDPDSSNRGMHDIKFSDSAYDRLIRMERAAKYTRPAEPAPTAQRPESAWQRFWNPVKKFFGLNGDQPEMLAAAPIGGQSTASHTSGRASSGASKSFSTSRYTPFANRTGPLDADDVLAALLDHDTRLEETARQLKKSAHELLPAKQAKEAAARIDQRKKVLKEKIDKQMLAFITGKKDGEGSTVDQTVTCRTGISVSLYKTASDCPSYNPTKHSAQQDAQIEKLSRENFELFRKNLSKQIDAPITMDKRPIVALVHGVTSPEDFAKQSANEEQNTDEEDEEDEQTKKAEENKRLRQQFIDYIAKENGCDKEKCVWLSLEEKAQIDMAAYYTQKAAGLNPVGVPFSKLSASFVAFDDKERIQKGLESISQEQADAIRPHAYPVTKSQFAEMRKKWGRHPVLATTGDVQGTMLTDFLEKREYGNILQGSADLFSQTNSADFAQKGAQLRESLEKRNKEISQIIDSSIKDLTQSTMTDVTKKGLQNKQQAATFDIPK